MKPLTIKKMVPKFDTDAICFGLPYRIILNGKAYIGVFYMIDEDRLEFKYFEDDKIKFVIMLPTVDDIEIYPCKSLSSDVNIELPELKKNKIPVVSKEDVPVESVGPDIKKFYIRDTRTTGFTKYPLFVKDNDELIINYDFMEKLLYDDSVLISISFGIKDHHSCANHTFKSKDVRIHVGGTTLTGKILDEYRNVVTCVEIRAGDLKQLEWARVVIKNRKEVTNNET